MKRVRAALVGAAGYTGAEFLRLARSHPALELVALCAETRAGQPLAEALPPFAGLEAELPPLTKFDAETIASSADFAVLGLPHGTAQDAADALRRAGVRVIDMSADHRFNTPEVFARVYGPHRYPERLAEAVYGLPELNRERVRTAGLVGVPGCYPTSVILAVRPALDAGLLATDEVIADCKSGVSGAGRTPGAGTHFPETSEGLHAYKTLDHRHAPEMSVALDGLKVRFTPHLVPMNRGILSTVYLRLKPGVDLSAVRAAYAERWARHWLDVVRYADSGGFETDILYEQASHYRDFVIRSIASNKPIDRFLLEQVAGDELWPEQAEEMSDAVAIWTLGPWQNALDSFPEMLEYVRRTDQVSTFGEAMLGLTVGCANCHNHKYDPISQRDYFGLEAVFAASETWDQNTNKKGWGRGERNHYRILRHASNPTPIRLLGRGELSKPRGLVGPSIPAFFPGGGELPDGNDENLHRRAQLAKWLVSPSNPLTARSFVNRVWQWHFGRAIAATPNDLGLKGDPPSHPELLDWLAFDFCENGWDLKHLHRRILLSATYQQAVHRLPNAIQTDPENKLLSSFPSRRLSAEEVWDHLHSAAGTLDLKCYGPPFVPALSAEELLGIYDIEQNTGKKWPVTAEQNRRAIYILNRRSFRFPFFEAFDPPNNSVSCPTRQTTTVPAQALTMLNNSTVAQQSIAMSERLIREAGESEAAQIELAWRLAYSREISDEERQAAQDFLAESRSSYKAKGSDRVSERVLADLCLAIFNTSEFISVN